MPGSIVTVSHGIFLQAKERSDQETIRKNEAKIIELGEWLQKQGNAKELGELVKNVRPYLGSLSKAKAARLVRTLVDLFLDMDSGKPVQLAAATCFLKTGSETGFELKIQTGYLTGFFHGRI